MESIIHGIAMESIVTYDTGGCAETVEGYDKAVVLRGADKNPQTAAQVIKEVVLRNVG